MGIQNWRHRGQARLVLSKVWPDGTRFRRFMPNKTVAKDVEKRIDYAVTTGRWRELKEELLRGPETLRESDPTISQFGDEYLSYCASRNRDLGFKQRQVAHLANVLGSVRLRAFKRRDADRFVDARRKQGASNATINRGLAVLKNMLTLAVERDYLDVHSLSRYRLLPEVQPPLRILGYDEYRRLVRQVTEEDKVIGAYAVFLGETGARKQEGLRLQWSQVDQARRIVSLGYTKSGKTRSVPLSDFAVESLDTLVRFISVPYVFVDPARQTRWKDPRGPFKKGCNEAGLDSVTFH